MPITFEEFKSNVRSAAENYLNSNDHGRDGRKKARSLIFIIDNFANDVSQANKQAFCLAILTYLMGSTRLHMTILHTLGNALNNDEAFVRAYTCAEECINYKNMRGMIDSSLSDLEFPTKEPDELMKCAYRLAEAMADHPKIQRWYQKPKQDRDATGTGSGFDFIHGRPDCVVTEIIKNTPPGEYQKDQVIQGSKSPSCAIL